LKVVLMIGLATHVAGQTQDACAEGASCPAQEMETTSEMLQVEKAMTDSPATTNLMQMKTIVAHRDEKEGPDEKEEAEFAEDVSEETKAWAATQDWRILTRMLNNLTVSEKERDGFFSRSKIFFKEPIAEETSADFCWKHSYNRGTSKVPSDCPAGTKKGEAASFLPICYQDKTVFKKCPAAYKDHGFICRAEMYGRGWGFFSETKCKASKEGKEVGGECGKFGFMYYPKCKAGWEPLGPICKPKGINKAKCVQDLGTGSTSIMGAACSNPMDLSALKPAYPNCPAGLELDTALCWPKCDAGYSGLSKICFQAKGTGDQAYSCGAGLAKDKLTCATVTGDQIFTVFKCVTNLATMGASAGAFKGVDAVVSVVSNIEVQYTNVMNGLAAIESAKAGDYKGAAAAGVDVVTGAIFGKTVVGPIKNLMTEDPLDSTTVIRESASILANWDPTGVAQAIRAFTWKVCPHTERPKAR